MQIYWKENSWKQTVEGRRDSLAINSSDDE